MLLSVALLFLVAGEQPLIIDSLVRFDLRAVVVSKECRAKAGEIVVCAAVPPNPDRHRLRHIVGVTFVYDDRWERKSLPETTQPSKPNKQIKGLASPVTD